MMHFHFILFHLISGIYGLLYRRESTASLFARSAHEMGDLSACVSPHVVGLDTNEFALFYFSTHLTDLLHFPMKVYP